MLVRARNQPSTPCSGTLRVAQRLAAAVAVLAAGGGLAVSTPACSVECAAGCDSRAHMLVRSPANALKDDPNPTFEVCSRICTTFQFDGTNCKLVGSGNGNTCTLTNEGLEFEVGIPELERDFVFVNVTAADGKLIFQGNAETHTTEFEVCGQTCHEADVEFTIP